MADQVDVRIRNGRVFIGGGLVEADLLVNGEKVVGPVTRDHPVRGRTEIDAAGKVVLPGMIDPHAHTRVPGYEYKEDFTTCSQAAAAGGITTIVDMPNVEPPTTTVKEYEEKKVIAARTCLVDWGHFVSPVKLDQIPAFAESGATGFKIFQVKGGYPHDPRLAMDEPERIYAAFSAIARTGLPCLMHPFNQGLMDYISDVMVASGKPRDFVTFSSIYTMDVVWRSAVAQVLELRRETGVRLHLLHTHSQGSLRLIRRAKADGAQGLTCAVDLKYFQLTDRDLREQGPRAAPGGFITSDPARMEAIWTSINDGTIDTIDSDHAPHTLEDLERFKQDPWTGPFGSPQYDNMLSVLLTDVHRGKLSLATLVRVFSENPARLLGLYPRKGALLPGSDADLVVVDLDKEWKASDETVYTKVKWTPYRGWTLKGKPVLTMLRGSVIMQDGKVTGKPGYGRYIEGVPQRM
ncbi:MAG TPA: amidohydrolase family protein [bacterium]|nr:amidohydrolase family protein [bacterium]